MKIYTKTGDTGETGLWGGARVPKDDLRIRTYGTVDELNAAVGIVLAEGPGPILAPRLIRIQGELFRLGAELATPRGKNVATALVEDEDISLQEREIDEMEKTLPPLKTFILPGGHRAAACLHLARTICRRAERELVTLNRAEPQRALAIQYLNRLSDYLFVAARFANHQAGVVDVPWIAPGKTAGA